MLPEPHWRPQRDLSLLARAAPGLRLVRGSVGYSSVVFRSDVALPRGNARLRRSGRGAAQVVA
eukprot:3114876-Rhodomonas_salina.4